jgi:biotin transport system substrate-specific component
MALVSRVNEFSKSAVAIAIGAIAIALGGRLETALPGTDVPQTAQTLAVLVVGVVLGPMRAGLAVAVFIGLGLAGVPVFAGGSSGLEVLAGLTAGYLVGFIAAAVVAGFWSRSRFADRIVGAFAGMILAHLAILFLGWLRLAIALGPADAYTVGVHPFWIGAVVKSLIAAVVCWAVARRRAGTSQTNG